MNKITIPFNLIILSFLLTACKSEITVSMIEKLKSKLTPTTDTTTSPTNTATNSKHYFSEKITGKGKELWVTDGTVSGTKLVKEIAEAHVNSNPDNFFKIGDKTIFKARDNEIDPGDTSSEVGRAVHGYELWVTDGTEAGTQMLKDINPGPGNSSPDKFKLLGDKAVFTANNSDNTPEVWITDGTSAGTLKLSNGLEVWNFEYSVVLDGKVYFGADDGVNGNELWVTDGTEVGTQLVKDLRVGPSSGDPEHFYKAGNKFYFFVRNTFGNYQLWISDGTSVGTTQLTTYAGTDGWNWVQGVVLPNNKFVYSNYNTNATYSGLNVFVSDGTPAGSLPLTNMNGNFSEPNFALLGDKVVFTNRTASEGREPWVTDGTVGGTIILKDINPSGDAFNLSTYIKFDDSILFSATASDGDYKLYRTNGTSAGTNDFWIVPEGFSSAEFYLGETVNSKLLVRRAGYYWILDKGSSTPVAIQKFHDLENAGNGYQHYRSNVGDKFLINYENDDTGKLELWVTDGSSLGTIKLAEFDTPPAA